MEPEGAASGEAEPTALSDALAADEAPSTDADELHASQGDGQDISDASSAAHDAARDLGQTDLRRNPLQP